jgi:hypothetical protein
MLDLNGKGTKHLILVTNSMPHCLACQSGPLKGMFLKDLAGHLNKHSVHVSLLFGRKSVAELEEFVTLANGDRKVTSVSHPMHTIRLSELIPPGFAGNFEKILLMNRGTCGTEISGRRITQSERAKDCFFTGY